jgi:hypothetical protein
LLISVGTAGYADATNSDGDFSPVAKLADDRPPNNAPQAVTQLTLRLDAAHTYDPFEAQPAVYDPFDAIHAAAPLDPAAYFPPEPQNSPKEELVQLQLPTSMTPDQDSASDATEKNATAADADPCGAMSRKSLGELGIDIMLPAGLLPKDHASLCWQHIQSTGGYLAALRCWPTQTYYWDATCLCHRPLYFEEINLERYGYGCCECIQPAVSAAHFFGTIPALPYCMAEHCPGDCEYTLGHYRPGSCPPWRFHWPSCDKIAAASEAGVLTGMIFLIP